MTIHNVTEQDVRAGALEHECPACGAAPGVRCRILTRNVNEPEAHEGRRAGQAVRRARGGPVARVPCRLRGGQQI
jgi:hypothetical protein